MSRKKLALSLVMGLGAFGCDGGGSGTLFPERDFVCPSGAAAPCMTTQPASTDAQRRREEPADMTGTTLTYVVNVLRIPKADGTRAVGFNVDMLNSGDGSTSGANCQEVAADFTSSLDPSHVGVDNALQGLVGTIEQLIPAESCPNGVRSGCLDATLARQISEGNLLLLAQVTGVDSLEYDASVTLRLALGEVTGGTPQVDGTGVLTAGQTFTTSTTLGEPVPGDIFNGRLRAATPSLMVTVDAGDFTIPLNIRNAEVRFDVGATGANDGVIGGVLTVDDVIQTAENVMPGVSAMARPIIEGVADVSPTSNPQICGSISVGLAMEATTAMWTP